LVRLDDTDRPLVPSPSSLIVDVNCDGKRDASFLGAQLIADRSFRDVFAPRVLSSTLAVAWVAAGRRAAYVTDGHLEGSVHFAAVSRCARPPDASSRTSPATPSTPVEASSLPPTMRLIANCSSSPARTWRSWKRHADSARRPTCRTEPPD